MTVSKAIDPARPGLGKGLLWATGSFGCERESWYSETVRDDRGWRLDFPSPEKVHFGKAIDVLHMTVTQRLVENGSVGNLSSAVDMAYHAGMAGTWDSDPDRDTFRVQIENAAKLLVGEAHSPNQPGIPIDWLSLDGIKAQGFDGRSIEIPGVFGERPLVATPDYLWLDGEGTITQWLDVKAVARAYSYPDKWLGAEAVTYTLACTLHSGGIPPTRIGYLEYRRNAKPYWAINWVESPTILNRLAERYVIRWRKALEAGDPDLLAFNPSRCGECHFARPLPEVQFAGCPIGMILPHVTTEGANSDD